MNELLTQTRQINILYAEDEPDIRTQMQSTFEILFKSVLSACDGRDGLKMYEENKDDIDLIVTDINMPHMDGIEMSRAIKKINPKAHIIIITAHNDLKFFSEAIEIGVDGFVIKPVVQEQLFQTLQKVVKSHQLELENERYKNSLEVLVKEKTEELERLYTHDRLTGCYSREKLEESLQENSKGFLALINIDNFDHLNSTYGFVIADEVLKQFVIFVNSTLQSYPLYRVGSDEFAFIVSHNDKEPLNALLTHLLRALENHVFCVNTIEARLTCTIGISQMHLSNALMLAHAAIKEVREIGKNRFHFYSSESNYIKRQSSNIQWMEKVKSALKNNTIIPYYQPIVDTKTKQIIKFECLARLRDTDKIISPAHFIEPAKLVGLLPDITRTMIEKSCSYFAALPYDFTLNITEEDLKSGFIPALLQQMSKRYAISPERITLEVLENISAQGTQEALDQLDFLKQQGFKLALDDFGSEKSNFFRLQNMSVDYIKIDGSFIKELNTNEKSLKIAQTITKLAHAMGTKVVAEFVCSEEVYNSVASLDIDYSQGYYFSEPLSNISKLINT